MTSSGERAFRLHYEHGLKYQEIAQKLGYDTVSAVRSAVYRWRQKNKDVAEAIIATTETKSNTGLTAPKPSDSEENISDEEEVGRHDLSDNIIEVWSAGCRIQSVDDLLTYFNINAADWEIIKQDVSYYEGQQRKVDKNLIYEDGKATGHVKQDGALIVPMIRIRVVMVRKEPVSIQPILQPIVPRATISRRPRKPNSMGVITEIDFGDVHIGYTKRGSDAALTPFHDRRALSILVQIIAHLKPDRIINVGDYLDCAEFTDKYIRLPEFKHTLQPALAEGYYWNYKIRKAAPNAEIYQIEGNHEERLRDLILKKFPEMYGIQAVDELKLPPQMCIDRLLALHKLDIEWVGNYPDGEVWAGDDRLSHGRLARKNPGSTAWAMIRESATSEGFGHTHRRALVSRTVWEKDSPRYISGWNGGCLCHIGEIDPQGNRRGPPGVTARQNWQKGFTIREYADNVPPSECFVLIQNGCAVVDGRVFETCDDFDGSVEELQAMYPRWNW
jgi:hypothetical protein